MASITPAILEKDFKEIKNKLSVLRGRVKTAQIDFCDGIFTPGVTWPFASGGFEDEDFQNIISEKEGFPYWQDYEFEFDMMTLDAVQNFDTYLKLGPKRIIFHIEAVGDVLEFRDFLEGLDMYIRESVEVGVAITVLTPLEKIFPLVPAIDFVQVMGIEKVGFQGQPFTEKCLEYVRTLKEKFPGIVISIDGAVNFETGQKLLEAGADRLGVGSALFKAGDIIGALEKFQNL